MLIPFLWSTSDLKPAISPLTFLLLSKLCFHSAPKADLHVDSLGINVFEGYKASSAILFCMHRNVSTWLDWSISVITLRAGVCQWPRRGLLWFFIFWVGGFQACKCVFMTPGCLRPPMHMHVSAFLSHNKRGDLIRSLCTISFFCVAADVSLYCRGWAYSCVRRRSAATTSVCRKDYLKPVSAARFYFFIHVSVSLVFAFISLALELNFKTINSL